MREDHEKAWGEHKRHGSRKQISEERTNFKAFVKVDKNNEVAETWKTEQGKRGYAEAYDEEGLHRDPDRVYIMAADEATTLRS